MTSRTWFGKLLARWRSNGRGHPAGRGRAFATLTLDTLPDRDSPYSLFGGEVVALEASTTTADAPRPPAARPEPRADSVERVVPTPSPGGAVRLSEPAGTPNQSALGTVAPVEPLTGTAPQSEAKTTTPRPRAGAALDRQKSAPPSAPTPVPLAADTPQSGPAAFRTDPPVAAFGIAVQGGAGAAPSAAADVSTPSGSVVTTPPTFLDQEPGGSIRLIPPPAVVPPGGTSGGTSGLGAIPTIPPSVPPPSVVPPTTTPPPNVSVTPAGVAVPLPAGTREWGAVGQPLQANTPVFRLTGTPTSGEPLVVAYTLSAHDAAGTVSVDGTATLTSATRPVTVTPGAALAGRTPDVLTLAVRERAGVRPVQPSATLFLTPVQRVGDTALFEAHRLGRSPEAFAALVQRHAAGVTRLSQGIVGSRADAEDVTQFVFLELAKRQARFAGTFTGWLRAVSRNASLAFLRSKRRRLRHEQEAARPVAAEPTRSIALDDGLIAAIGRLPAELGEAVRLRYVDGYSQQEAAEILGCPRGTLSRRAAYGIRLLRDILRDEQNACELS